MRHRITVAVAFFLAGVGWWAMPAESSAPRQQGWWTASPLAGPDVPDGGFLIEGAAAAPTSFAALVYDVGDDATIGKLKLVVAPSSATIPNVTLQLCPLAEPAIQPVEGGAMADAPEFDCGTKVTAQPGSDGSTYEFDAASLAGDGVLAVAIVGTTPADRVVFSAPDGNSLPVQQTAPLSAGAGSASAGSGVATRPAPADSYSAPLPAPAPSVPSPGDTAEDRSNDAAGRGSFATSETSSLDDETAQNRELVLVLVGVAIIIGAWLAIGRNAAVRAAAGSMLAGSEGGTE